MLKYLDIQNSSKAYTCSLKTQPGDYLAVFDDTRLTSGRVRSSNVQIDIPAGSYDISLQSYDGYETRVDVKQEHEQYFVSFHDDSGFIARSNATEDLQDNVAEASWSGQVNSNFFLGRHATQLVAEHAFYDDTSSPNSVQPICMLARPKEICGNGIKDTGEECDDGNTTSGDGCESDCTKPDKCNDICTSAIDCTGFICSSGKCRNTNCTSETDCICATCGNGTLNTGEECDDGNTTSGDGCNSACQTEKKEDDEEEEEENDDCDASIGDTVWIDINSNGKKELFEKGLPNITLKLLRGDKTTKKTTNSSGQYKFKNLCEGIYTVVVDAKDIPEGCYQVYDPDGKMDNTDKVKLDEGEDYKKADFGYRCAVGTPATGSGAITMLIATFLAMIIVIFIKKRADVANGLRNIFRRQNNIN